MNVLLKWLGYNEAPQDDGKSTLADKANKAAQAKLHRVLDRHGIAGLAEVDKILAGERSDGKPTSAHS